MISKDNLREVISSQREWILSTDRGIAREELIKIKPTESFAIVISGIRRCGKSTLLGQMLEKQHKFYYLNLEDPRLDGFDLNDFNKTNEIFEEIYGPEGIYFFDEIQNVPQWERFIRFLTDRKAKAVITGSNASLLSRELGTKLTGRHIQTELFPFSFLEFIKLCNMKENIDSFEKYMFKGGFPEFLKKDDETILHELLRDVIMRDIAIRYGIKNTGILNKLAIYLVSNIGKELSFNSLKQILEVKSVQSIIDYLSYLEDSYLIFTIPRFSYSYKKQQVNPKKVYSIDNGLSGANSVSFSKDKGKMLENLVFISLRKKYKDIFYFQEKGECDFVIKEGAKITQAIQVCFDLNEDNKNREINGLIEALEKFNLSEGIILTYKQDDEFRPGKKKIKVMPVWKWLLEKTK